MSRRDKLVPARRNLEELNAITRTDLQLMPNGRGYRDLPLAGEGGCFKRYVGLAFNV